MIVVVLMCFVLASLMDADTGRFGAFVRAGLATKDAPVAHHTLGRIDQALTARACTLHQRRRHKSPCLPPDASAQLNARRATGQLIEVATGVATDTPTVRNLSRSATEPNAPSFKVL